MGWLGTFANRRKITVDSTKVDSVLSSFPTPVPISAAAGLGADDLSSIFSSLEFTGDDFTGIDGDPPNTDIWTDLVDAGGVVSIQNNALEFNASGIAGASSAYFYSAFYFPSDFDIEFDFVIDQLTAPSSGINYGVLFHLFNTAHTNDLAYVARRRTTTADHGFAYGDDHTAGQADANTDSSGKYRVTRVSGEVRIFRWTGSAWGWNGDPNGWKALNNHTDNVVVRFYFSQVSGSDVQTTIDSFIINSGTVSFAGLNYPSRKKIAFTTSDGTTQLKAEIENFDLANELALYHVAVPSILSSTDTDLYFYWDSAQPDNTTYIGDTGDTPAQDVWDSGYEGVWHLAQDPTGGAGCILDSTNTGRNGTPNGSMTTGDLISGPNGGKALEFDGINDYVNVGNVAATPILTIEYMGKHGVDEVSCLISKYGNKSGASSDWLLLASDSQAVRFITWVDGYEESDSSDTFSIGDYFYAAASFAADNIKRVYIDDVAPAASGAKSGDVDSNEQPVLFGARGLYSGLVYEPGIFAEIRLSSIARSAAWLKATNYGLKDTLLTWSALEEYSGGGIATTTTSTTTTLVVPALSTEGYIVAGGVKRKFVKTSMLVNGQLRSVLALGVTQSGVLRRGV